MIVAVTTAGQLIASLTMVLGIFVMAFPVSVFTDLWSRELQRQGWLEDDNDDNANDLNGSEAFQEDAEPRKGHVDDSSSDNQSQKQHPATGTDGLTVADMLLKYEGYSAEIADKNRLIQKTQQEVKAIMDQQRELLQEVTKRQNPASSV